MAIWHKEVSQAIDEVVDNPDIVALYRRWLEEHARDGRLPGSAGFWPDGPFAALDAHLMALEADGDDFIYRHHGAGIAGPLGTDMRGRRVSEFTGEVGQFFLDCYRRVAARGQPMYTVHFSNHAPSVLTWERLILPVRGADGRAAIAAYARPLEARHEILEAVLNATGDAVLALRRRAEAPDTPASWLVLVANEAFARIMGVTHTGLAGRAVAEVLPRWTALAADRDCLAAVRTLAPVTRELDLDDPDRAGETRHFNACVAPLGDGCVLHLTDVTALKRAERALRLQTAQLKLDNLQLEHLASKDGLTGLANRRALDAYLDREMAHARRSGAALSLALCDIDYFKAYNDLYGHLAGDDVICEVAAALSAAGTRAADLVARYGGEEFVLVMRDAGILGALEVVHRAQDMLRQRAVVHGASPTGPLVTLSFGVAEFNPARDQHPAALIERADAALYRAKQAGRNRTEVDE